MNKVAIFGGTAILGLSLILAACNNGTTAPIDNGGGTTAVVIAFNGNSYNPMEKEVNVGTEVTIPASFVHPLKGVDAANSNPISATQTTDPVKIKFDKVGTYEYFCTVHGAGSGTMKGKIIVK